MKAKLAFFIIDDSEEMFFLNSCNYKNCKFVDVTRSEFNQCVDLHADHVFRFIVKSIQDEDKAKDVVQESFAKMWTKHRNIEAKKAKSYLFSTAYHTMIDDIRKEKKSLYSSVDENISDYKNEHYSDLQEILHEAVQKLPEIQRSVILLRDYEGYSYKEIEEVTGLNESQVKVYIYRARLFLKEYLVSIEHIV